MAGRDGRHWHNHLPAWILEDPKYRVCSASVRRTLQTIADFGDRADAGGDLRGALGGAALVAAIGCSRATFTRHVSKLISYGFVQRTTTTGGPTTYKIPGKRCPAGRPKMDRGTPRPRRGRWHVEPGTLRDTTALLDLFDRWVVSGKFADGEAQRLRFVSAAEYAMRTARVNAEAWFVNIVRGERWLFISEADEQRAVRRIKAAEFPDESIQMPKVRLPSTKRKLSSDGALAAAAIKAAACAGHSGDPFYLAKQREPELSRERWNAALIECGESRHADSGF